MSAGEEDSVRSHAVAGIWYIDCGGVVFTSALLFMRDGLTTITWPRSGPVPLEFIAGVAGIVVFMGLVQLLIAFILKVRGRQ
jgi:hypothetical protein